MHGKLKKIHAFMHCFKLDLIMINNVNHDIPCHEYIFSKIDAIDCFEFDEKIPNGYWCHLCRIDDMNYGQYFLSNENGNSCNDNNVSKNIINKQKII